MNIIKFQDTIIEGNTFFNDNLKGKYAYNVNMLWVFPFDKLTPFEFTALSRGDVHIESYAENEDYVVYTDYIEYVDIEATEKANSIDKFAYLNSYATDPDITIEELKLFRTWLASSILNNTGDFIAEFVKDNTGFDEVMIRGMLGYYANEMTDSTTSMLSMFAPGMIVKVSTTGASTCGCVGSVPSSGILTTGVPTACDPLFIYTQEVYKYMIKCFSEISFWDNDYLRDTIVVDFKHYIDNILKSGLPLTSSVPNRFEDCTCLNTDHDLQKRYETMLEKLSESLQYIIDGKVDGNKNFVFTALNDWATYLYEKMRW